jgi:hypothetical protein
MHLEDGHHVVELTVQATEEHEDTICRSGCRTRRGRWPWTRGGGSSR